MKEHKDCVETNSPQLLQRYKLLNRNVFLTYKSKCKSAKGFNIKLQFIRPVELKIQFHEHEKMQQSMKAPFRELSSTPDDSGSTATRSLPKNDLENGDSMLNKTLFNSLHKINKSLVRKVHAYKRISHIC